VKKALNTLLAIAVVAAVGASLAQAQTGHDHHAAASAPAAKATQTAPADMTEGEVRKVDAAARKITLKHGPIKNLDMPAMTMVFDVPDAALLAKVKAGDKVRFVAANPGGKLTVTDIQPVK
jgi:Cu(I)/Ag(I) efflux system periplasmic protein CusF